MEQEQLILHSAQEFNILPLTSYCDARCIFCSHQYNPPQVRVVKISPRTLAEVERTLVFLDRRKKITIGESATRIIEGEPFSHPRFFEVLQLVREKFPATPISLTTNGHGLDEEAVRVLKAVQPVEINVSLNSATSQGRSILMRDNDCRTEKTLTGIKLLQAADIPFHGSIVAMPYLTGWDDLAHTILFLADHGALTMRIFMAGYGKNADPGLQFDPEIMHGELAAFVEGMREKTCCPLLLEPPALPCLEPITAGVIRGSKADQAGIKRGDWILAVNGKAPRSRVEAWQYAQQPGNITVQVKRQDQELHLAWHNKRPEKSGLVMEYDFDLKRLEEIKRKMGKYPGVVLLLCSRLGYSMIKAAWEVQGLSDDRVDIQPAENHFFGGSIGAAGLLTMDDFYAAYLPYEEMKGKPGLIILPGEAFDYAGRDLTGRSFQELEEKTGVKVIIG